MTEIGYSLSSEEHGPRELIEQARRAEEVGFTFALISDHFHPWIDQQGNSPFVWTTLGGIAQVTDHLRLGTGVTCPTFRYHPAIVAQAAATVACLLPGRFFLGVGTGEYLNEHILGDHWPDIDVRQDMLEEAVEIIRELWTGDEVSFWGGYYTVEKTRIFTLPQQETPIYLAAAGPDSAELAGKIGDGLVSVAPEKEVVETFEKNGGAGKQKIGQITVVWAEDETQARNTMLKWWPNTVVPGSLSQQLQTPSDFEAIAKIAKPEDIVKHIVLGPDPEKHIQGLQQYVDAGFDQVYVHQIGPDQEGFFRFYQKEIIPRFNRS